MRISQVPPSLLLTSFVVLVLAGGQRARAQAFRLEAGGGWAIPSSSVDMPGSIEGGAEGFVPIDPGAGLHGYASVGLVWTISSNFAIGLGVRAQQAQMPGDAGDLIGACDGCTASNNPDGRLRTATIEGRIMLTSVGRITPYFLVGLGVVRTTVEGVQVDAPDGTIIRFSEVEVTDAGGDVGFGGQMRFLGNLALNAEIRATGSLPGAKENAVTTFPFSLGLSYGL